MTRTVYLQILFSIIIFCSVLYRYAIPEYLQVSAISSKERKLSSVLCKEDKKRVELLVITDPKNVTTTQFFQTVMYPVQTGCSRLKKLGGLWAGSGYDGGKYICMDDVLESEEPCLIYSAGIGGDASFEQAMAAYGCVIHAYDHTIRSETVQTFEKLGGNFILHLKGIGSKTSGNLSTLEDLMAENDHLQSSITYLKVDIEGPEVDLFPSWLESGLLDRVKQIGVEFHSAGGINLAKYFRLMRDLLEKGWKIIAFDPNFDAEVKDKKFMYFEVVFRRVKTPCDFDRAD